MEKLQLEAEIGYLKADSSSKFKPQDFINTIADLVEQGEAEGFTGIYVGAEVQKTGETLILVKGIRLETNKELAARLKAEIAARRTQYESYLQAKAYYESEEGKKEVAGLD
jgi:hypothetical protein